jgi:hypothetical protein
MKKQAKTTQKRGERERKREREKEERRKIGFDAGFGTNGHKRHIKRIPANNTYSSQTYMEHFSGYVKPQNKS